LRKRILREQKEKNVQKPTQWIGIVFGVFVGLGLGIVMETRAAPRMQAIPEVVQARQFQVVDHDGTVRMQFGMEADGAARLSLLGKNSKRAVVVQVDSNGDAGLSLRDREEQERASLAVAEDRGTVLALSGKDGQPIAALAVLPDGSEALSLVRNQRGDDGKTNRAGTMILTGPDGKTEMRYYNKSGKMHLVNP
jgi:hypothetical protein